MATQVSLLAVSPNMLRYDYAPTGAGNNDELTVPKMIADAQQGPLRAFLSRFVHDSAGWDDLLTDPTLSIFIAGSGAPPLVGYSFTDFGGARVLELSASDADDVIVEIRFNLTPNR